MRYAHGLPKVFVLASEFPPGPGGIGTHAHQVALELHARGWIVSVCAPQDLAADAAIAAFNAAQPFAVHRLRRVGRGPLKLAHRLAAVSRRLRADRPDLIVGSGERMVWLAAVLHYMHGIPYVAVGHAMEFNRTPRWEYALTRRSFEAAAGAVCVSKYTWSRMIGCGIRVQRGEVIPNGADDNRFGLLSSDASVAFRKRHGFDATAKLLVTVGSVHERKGQDIVIRALPRVRERVPNVHYVVVGMPYRRDSFLTIARELGVEDHVHFLGAVDHDALVAALNAADLFVMASQHTKEGDFEGFGIAVLEAALCGRAAVVSDDSGVVEAIVPGQTGLVAKMGDSVATADRIVEALTGGQLEVMGQRARARALENTWKARGAQYDSFLRSLVSATPRVDVNGTAHKAH